MEVGWIKIHRSITAHWIWADPVKLKWWLDLILMANYDEGKMLNGNKLIELKRGQFVRSYSKLAQKWNVSKKSVYMFILLLESDTMITTESIPKGKRITICNYDRYQISGNDEDTNQGTISGNDEDSAEGSTKETKRVYKRRSKEVKKLRIKEKGIQNSPDGKFCPSPVSAELFKEIIKIHSQWFERPEIAGVKYNFKGGKDGKAAREIAKHLSKAVREKNTDATNEDILTAWQMVLDYFPRWELFYQNQKELSQIFCNINNIMANIRNSHVKPGINNAINEFLKQS